MKKSFGPFKKDSVNDDIKRFFDVFLSEQALVALAPVFAVTAIAIKCSSPGPVFYKSKRVGKDRKSFDFYKFRSMHQTDNDKRMFVADADRLFTVGKIIRRLKIDELPQLVNVLKGDMSIVGPRPMTEVGVNFVYGGKYEKITSIKPGLTSPASLYDYVVGDTYTDNEAYTREVLPVKQEMELYYVEHESLKYDAELIARTALMILEVFAGKKQFADLKELKIVRKNLDVNGSGVDKETKKTRVLLIDTAGRQALAILRGLKEADCDVTVACTSERDICYVSKLPDDRILFDGAKDNGEKEFDFIMKLLKTGNYDVLFPVGELSTEFVTNYEEEFGKYAKLACTTKAAYAFAGNKQMTYETAKRLGIPIPHTRMSDETVDEFLASAKFPVIVKPRHGMGSMGYHKFDTEADIRKAIADKLFDPDEYIIQEFVAHNERHGTYIMMDKTHTVKSFLASKVIRWYPVDAGTSCASMTIEDDIVREYATRLLTEIGWQGYANVGFMVDEKTGERILLEINGRIPAPVKLTFMVGFNVSKQLVEMALDKEVTDYGVNKKYGYVARHTQADLMWLLKSPNRFKTDPSWFNWKHNSDLVFWKDDPKPFFYYTFGGMLEYKSFMAKRKR